VAGNDQVMLGIGRLASTGIPFAWVRCEGDYPSTGKEHVIADPTVGPDSDDTPWTLPSVSSEDDASESKPSHQTTKKAGQGEKVRSTGLKAVS
jgi:hypothetical protein